MTWPPSSSSGAVASQALYGDGADGPQTFDGIATILGMVPASGAYTLTRDFFLANTTLNAGIRIITAGYRLFVAGTLTYGTAASIVDNGNNANGAVAGGALQTAQSSINTLNRGGGGANGGTGAGGNGSLQSAPSYSGNGGNGGSAGANAGGNGGACTLPASTRLPAHCSALSMMLGAVYSAGAWNNLGGGAGGGAGGGDGVNNGGGGGGGGGMVIVCAQKIVAAGAPGLSIQAAGGLGGQPPAGNCGGGGGGSGGLAVLISQAVTQAGNGTFNVLGVSVSAPTGFGSPGIGTGNPGLNGGVGQVFILPG